MAKKKFYHLKIDLLSTGKVLAVCEQYLGDTHHHSLYFLNAHCFNVSLKNTDYQIALENADLILNDGVGIKIAAMLARVPVVENMNGTDFIPKLLSLAADKKVKIFLLGGMDSVAESARLNLAKKIPGLVVSGIASGYFSSKQESNILAKINQSKAEILIVGMGVPYQEIWINQNKHKFGHVKISVAGGAILDFFAGKVSRAPQWIQNLGLEWLFRFVQEPQRLFSRYFIGNFVFIYNILSISIKRH